MNAPVIVLNQTPVQTSTEEVQPNLFLHIRPSSKNPLVKVLQFENISNETRYTITYVFETEVPITAHSKTTVMKRNQDKETVFTLWVDPQEKLNMLSGPFVTHFGRSFKASTPDKPFYEDQKRQFGEAIEPAMQDIRMAIKKAQREGTMGASVSSDAVAQLCTRLGMGFIDLAFSPNDLSLFGVNGTLPGGDTVVCWQPPAAFLTPEARRAKQKPSLFANAFPSPTSISPFGINQGALGNCYFLAALVTLALDPSRVRDLFPPNQEGMENGVYRAMLCKHGWWQAVVVDDFLPANKGRLYYSRNSAVPHQLWVPLIEKVFAKLHGSFQALRSGDTMHALGDMLGTPYVALKHHPLHDNKDALFQWMSDAISNAEEGCLITFSSASKKDALAATYAKVGIVSDHVYALLATTELRSGQRLCLLRNPWGGAKQGNAATASDRSHLVSEGTWTGRWGPQDTNSWTSKAKDDVAKFFKTRAPPSLQMLSNGREALPITGGEAGVFWMQWEDVLQYFPAGGITRALREWTQVRTLVKLQEGPPLTVARLTVRAPLKLIVGAHQKDKRCAGGTDYIGLCVGVVHNNVLCGRNSNASWLLEDCTATKDAPYGMYRDVFTGEMLLAPSTDPYYILVQGGPKPVSATVVLSMILSSEAAVSHLDFMDRRVSDPSVPSATNYYPLTKFNPAHYEHRDTPAETEPLAQYQVRRFSKKSTVSSHPCGLHAVHTSLGNTVDFSGLLKPRKAATKHHHSNPNSTEDNGVMERNNEATAAPSLPVTLPPASNPPPTVTGSITSAPAEELQEAPRSLVGEEHAVEAKKEETEAVVDGGPSSSTPQHPPPPLPPSQPSVETANGTPSSAPVTDDGAAPLTAAESYRHSGRLNILILDAAILDTPVAESPAASEQQYAIKVTHELIPTSNHTAVIRSTSTDEKEGLAAAKTQGDSDPFVTRWVVSSAQKVETSHSSQQEAPSPSSSTPASRRVVWCEPTTVSAVETVDVDSSAQPINLERSQIRVQLLLQTTSSSDPAMVRGEGTAVLRGRSLERTGPGQMITVKLSQLPRGDDESGTAVEIGELHLGVSWV